MQNFFLRLTVPLITPSNVPDLEAVLWYSRHFFAHLVRKFLHLCSSSVFDSLWVLCWSYWPTSATEKLWKLRSLRTTRGDHTIYGLSTSLFLCPHSQNLDIELLTWALKTGPIERRTRNSRSFGSCKTIPKKVNLKVGRWGLFEIRPFYSVFLMRKPLSKGRKWPLRPYFPLIWGMFG